MPKIRGAQGPAGVQGPPGDTGIVIPPFVPEIDKFYERPWGGWKLIETDPYTKILTLAPGGMLSLQTHADRTETWTPLGHGLIAYTYKPEVKGEYGWTMQEEEYSAVMMEPGQFYTMSRRTQHRLINPTDKVVKLIEKISGTYDENDIVRLQDIYDR